MPPIGNAQLVITSNWKLSNPLPPHITTAPTIPSLPPTSPLHPLYHHYPPRTLTCHRICVAGSHLIFMAFSVFSLFLSVSSVGRKAHYLLISIFAFCVCHLLVVKAHYLPKFHRCCLYHLLEVNDHVTCLLGLSLTYWWKNPLCRIPYCLLVVDPTCHLLVVRHPCVSCWW